jgi:hypothetical protein
MAAKAKARYNIQSCRPSRSKLRQPLSARVFLASAVVHPAIPRRPPLRPPYPPCSVHSAALRTTRTGTRPSQPTTTIQRSFDASALLFAIHPASPSAPAYTPPPAGCPKYDAHRNKAATTIYLWGSKARAPIRSTAPTGTSTYEPTGPTTHPHAHHSAATAPTSTHHSMCDGHTMLPRTAYTLRCSRYHQGVADPDTPFVLQAPRGHVPSEIRGSEIRSRPLWGRSAHTTPDLDADLWRSASQHTPYIDLDTTFVVDLLPKRHIQTAATRGTCEQEMRTPTAHTGRASDIQSARGSPWAQKSSSTDSGQPQGVWIPFSPPHLSASCSQQYTRQHSSAATTLLQQRTARAMHGRTRTWSNT